MIRKIWQKIFGNKPKEIVLNSRELSILQRENEESSKHAMPNAIMGDSFGEGSITNNISRIASTVSQSGPNSLVTRRVLEPRKGWGKSEQEKL